VWNITPGQQIGRTDVTIRVIDGSDPTLFDEMTITVTIGAQSSSERRAALVAGLLPAPDTPQSTATEASDGVQRTLVIMARAGMGSARAFGAPFLLLVILAVLVLSLGRISIHPVLGRSPRQSGTVAWFDTDSGYGFVIPDDADEELFLHRSALGRGRVAVTPGDRVTFRTVRGSERSFALTVRDEGRS
jgi:cold shock CspA family protein